MWCGASCSILECHSYSDICVGRGGDYYVLVVGPDDIFPSAAAAAPTMAAVLSRAQHPPGVPADFAWSRG